MASTKKTMGAPLGKREQNSAQTRKRILQAGIRQFSKHGFAGARIEQICDDAMVNARMVYHYFGDKGGLYVAVLETALENLRSEELKLEVENNDVIEGLLTMFDFVFNHFSKHPELIRLLSAENLMEAEFLKSSKKTPLIASPVIKQIEKLLIVGSQNGVIRKGIEPLHLYITMVSMSYFHKSNAYTLSHIFDSKIKTKKWQSQYHQSARIFLEAFLKPN